jgi:DNA-directed RNA polymerase subunit L
LTEPDPLPDDHPEVVAYRNAHPIPQELLRPLTDAERQRNAQMQKQVEDEHEAIRNAVAAFNQRFSELEIALSALLYECINVKDRNSKVAYAVYYSPTSFDARCDIVENVVKQLAIENKPLAKLTDLWTDVEGELNKVRRLRNAVAHSSPNTLGIRGKNHARMTAPPFDVIRVGRPIALGRIPGLTSSEIRDGIKTACWAIERIDDFNRAIAVFHEAGNPTLPEKLAALKRGLQAARRAD